MQKLIPIIVLLALAVSPMAIAQTGTTRDGSPTPSAGPLPAPVGHRQPTPNSVPENTYKDPNAKENAKMDAILDQKMKGICRGC
jgi:hypothetical protein